MPSRMRWHVYLLVDDIQEAEVAVLWDAILAALKTSYGVYLAMCMSSACAYYAHY